MREGYQKKIGVLSASPTSSEVVGDVCGGNVVSSTPIENYRLLVRLGCLVNDKSALPIIKAYSYFYIYEFINKDRHYPRAL